MKTRTRDSVRRRRDQPARTHGLDADVGVEALPDAQERLEVVRRDVLLVAEPDDLEVAGSGSHHVEADAREMSDQPIEILRIADDKAHRSPLGPRARQSKRRSMLTARPVAGHLSRSRCLLERAGEYAGRGARRQPRAADRRRAGRRGPPRGRARALRSFPEREDPRLPAGKIPTPVLVSRLGKERIYTEAVDSHIGGWFWSAAARSRVRPIAQPSYDYELPAADDQEWSFSATVEVQPPPDLVDWTQLEVGRAETDVPEEAVAQALDALRSDVAELVPAEGRPAREGDTAVIDLLSESGRGSATPSSRSAPAASSRRSRPHSSACRRESRRRSPTSSPTTRAAASRSRSRS
jgi:hypothetical protein